MAISYQSKAITSNSTSNPITVNIFTGYSTNLAVLLIISSTGARTGGSPTFAGGTTMELVDTQSTSSGQVEMWYALNQNVPKSVGTSFSIPNSSTDTLTCVGVVFDGSGAFPIPWIQFYSNVTSSGTNKKPSANISPAAGRVCIVDVMYGEVYSLSSFTNNKTLIYRGLQATSAGIYGTQYTTSVSSNPINMSYTIYNSVSWGMVVGQFVDFGPPDFDQWNDDQFSDILFWNDVSWPTVAKWNTLNTKFE